MTTKPRSHTLGGRAIGFGLAGAVVYLLMVGITLDHLETVSGQRPLDLRPSGYQVQEVRDLFTALGAEGRRYYLFRQLPLDVFYPALLALTLICTMRWFGQRLAHSKIVQIGVVLSISVAVFDYCENIGIATMLLSWPALPATLVHLSSAASVAKSVLTVAALVMLVLIGGLWGLRRKTEPRP